MSYKKHLKHVGVMLTQKDKDDLVYLSRYYGLNVTDFIRSIIRSRKAKEILGGKHGERKTQRQL